MRAQIFAWNTEREKSETTGYKNTESNTKQHFYPVCKYIEMCRRCVYFMYSIYIFRYIVNNEQTYTLTSRKNGSQKWRRKQKFFSQ